MWVSAFLLGFLGSWHCVGMCGPIGLAIPVPREKRGLGFTLYHLGRIGIYSLFGLLLATIGFSASYFEAQRTLTFVLGGILILIVLVPAMSSRVKSAYFNSPWMHWVRTKTVERFKTKTLSSSFLAGALNGFLPCGLIYLAGAMAMLAATPIEGAGLMALFGLGTVPGLFLVWMLPTLQLKKVGSSIVKLAPAFSILMGLILIYRGLSVEIPVLDSYLGAAGFGKITMCR